MTDEIVVKEENKIMDIYYSEIKDKLEYNEIYKKEKELSKNINDLSTYYEVGKLLSEAGKHYGEGIIKKYSVKLTEELGKGYTYTTLTRMLKFYHLMGNIALSAQYLNVTWSHFIELLPINDINKVNYYLKITKEQNLSRDKLREKIKSKEYERLDDKTKEKLKEGINVKPEIGDFIRHPIIVPSDIKITNEKQLHIRILENIESFMNQLGEGYTFMASEYKLVIDNRNYHIDLLLFNYIYNCFVVVELKFGEVKKEDYGQIKFYMNYIDSNLKRINQEYTYGIIVCQKEDECIIQYCYKDRISTTTYKIEEKI